MKKFFDYLLSLLVMVAFSGLTVACGGDDDDESAGGGADVVGTWEGLDYDTFYSNVYITFNSNGTGSATLDHEGAYSSYRRAEFTYKVNGNKVTTKGTMVSANSNGESSQSDCNVTFEVDGNILYVISGSGWLTGNVQSYINRSKPASSNGGSGSGSSDNSMRGKTIVNAGTEITDSYKYVYNNSIRFTSNTNFEHIVDWEYYFKNFSGGWYLDSSNNQVNKGTYTYSGDEIVLTYDWGKKVTLKRSGSGWLLDKDLYK